MASPIYGFLGQLQPSASSLSPVYTVPTGRRAIARVLASNAVGSVGAFRVAIEVGGESDAPANYIAYDMAIQPNDSVSSVPIALNAGDVVNVRSASGSVAFSVTGIEQDI